MSDVKRKRSRRRSILAALVLLVTGMVVTPATPVHAYTTVVYNGAGSAPHISIIGDSTIAALRWTNTFGPLRRFNYVYDAESCRRTATVSCRGREGYPPDNVISTMRRLNGRLGSVLAIMGGYDDPGFGFASAVDAVMAEAERQGIPAVMWLTLRTADVSYVGPTFRSNSTTFRDNNRILLLKAAQYGSRLQIADWATYSARRPDWFYSDGIHLRPSGALAAADFIADQAERVLGQINSGWPELRINANGRLVAEVQEALVGAGVAVRGGVTGRFDIWTYYAVRTFQRYNGLTVTGYVDAATARKLGLLGPSWTPSRRGSTGESVRRVQQALIDRGVFVRGGVTGVFDVYTMYAVQTFQRWQGLTASGVVDYETARRLGVHQAPNPDDVWRLMSFRDTGINVARAQRALIDAGIFVRGGATGTFDIYTWYAVNTFQRSAGLTVTGRIDAATASALGLFDHVDPIRGWVDLRLGSVGAFVQRAQRALVTRGIIVRGGANGVFAVGTYYAVLTFQRHNGLPVTGRIDLATADRLGLFDTVQASASATLLAAPLTVTAATTTTTTSTTTTTVPTSTTAPTTSTSTTTEPVPTAEPAGTEPSNGTIGDRVWIDADGDGLQDDGESGEAGVVVRLLDESGAIVADDVTDPDGRFTFTAAIGAVVRIEADVPADHLVTEANQLAPGLDAERSDEIDSDFEVDVDTGVPRTGPTAVTATGLDNVALGLVPAAPSPTTDSSTTQPPTTESSSTTQPPPTESSSTTEPPTTASTVVPTTAPPTSAATSTTTVPATAPPTAVETTPPPETTAAPTTTAA